MTDLVNPPELVEVDDLDARWTMINAADNQGLVIGTVAGDLKLQVERLRKMERLDAEYVRATLDSYVERVFTGLGDPQLDLEAVVHRLREHHVVALLGEPDSGRRTAAVAVLGQLRIALEKIPGWEPGQAGQFSAADLPATPGTGYLFVHPDDEVAAPEVGRQLRAYRDKLAAKGCFLLVVARVAAWRAAGDPWPEATFHVSAPDGRAVLQAQVRGLYPRHDPAEVLADERIRQIVATASPRDASRLANLLVQTVNGGGPQLSVDDAIAQVVGAYQEWTTDLDTWFDRNRDAGARLFLLTAAVLESSPARRILRYAEDLEVTMEGGQPGRQSITTAGIRELAKTAGARVEEPGGELYFARPAYATAVLDYVMADRSDGFRTSFAGWLARAPKVRHQGEAVQVATLVGGAVLGLVRRHRDLSFVTALVREWASARPLQPTLVSLVTAVALTPEAGARMRGLLNQWATSHSSPQVWQLVADVCTGDLADAYPRVALTRIKNLALRAEGELVALVVDAVLKLWERPALRRDILDRLLSWLAEPGTPAFAVASHVVAGLADQSVGTAFDQRLEGDPALAVAIGNLLEHVDQPEHLRDTLYGWLDAAVADDAFAEWLITVLALSIRGPGSALRITCIRTFAYGWESREVSTVRAALRERLVTRVSNADATVRAWVRATTSEGGHDGWLV
ncbi:hypothetical protein ACPCHT_06080 [Nucisporomicrobium flavum]|uniref:hypothetical protein n=1 Tax=Nucisporomicrobium flavum TaxID=2785915 RepID=UPI003C30C6A3